MLFQYVQADCFLFIYYVSANQNHSVSYLSVYFMSESQTSSVSTQLDCALCLTWPSFFLSTCMNLYLLSNPHKIAVDRQSQNIIRNEIMLFCFTVHCHIFFSTSEESQRLAHQRIIECHIQRRNDFE